MARERWSPRVAAGGSPRPPWGWGLRVPGPGWEGPGAAEVGRGVSERLAGARRVPRGAAADLCCAESPRAWPRLSSRSQRVATTARCEAAALASRSWPLCSGSSRGASREVSPSPLFLCWQGCCGTKPYALPLLRSMCASAFASDWGIRHVGLPLGSWKECIRAAG